jgi:glycine/D-amino acid oxidase-like deaminating enzyme
MVSLWMEQVTHTPRPVLQQDLTVDVVIIGAGFTGLWTAYYLNQAQPDLTIAIVEAKHVGFGASGRNGGWLMGEIAGADDLLKHHTKPERQASHHLIHDIPDEVARICAKENIHCDLKKGGVLYCAARYPEQRQRLQKELADYKQNDYSEQDFTWLNKSQLDQQLKMAKAQGAMFSPHVATIQPAKLVMGLAQCLESKGVIIYENSPVMQWQSGDVKTHSASIKAKWIVPAVEAYGTQLKPINQYQLAVYSLIIATEPLSQEIWNEIGLEKGQAFSESSRLISYGQRTADNRLVFGARGGYSFGGRLRHDFTHTETEMALRLNLLHECFPVLKERNIKVSHSWGGNLALPRRFHLHMLCDRTQGIALAGGYLGEGVGATNLAGRTLADLILNKQTLHTQQPWVKNNQPISALKKWEPEPIRWLTYKTLNKMLAYEDKVLADLTSPKWKRKCVVAICNVLELVIS